MLKNYITNSYKGINGITVIDSNHIGPNVGIFAVTHGNEPVGLQVFNHLKNEFKLTNKLLKGKVYLIAINIEAYEKYSSHNDPLQYRFVDHNMNRIYGKQFQKKSSEFQRLEKLKTIFDEIDIALDLHSVSKGNDVICVTDLKFKEQAQIIFDVETILVDNIVKSGAMIGYFIENNKEAYGLECGNHTDSQAYINGINNTINLLIDKGMIEGNKNKNITLNGTFKFIEEVIPKHISFRYSKDYTNFEKIETNEVYASEEGKNFINPLNKEAYIGLVGKKVTVGDGIGFIFEKLN